jgi:two-component system chemotaxis sensor kinase CheA
LPLAGAIGAEVGNDKVRLFRLNDGLHEIAYAFAEVIDFATIEHDVIHAERPGEISGVSLVNNEPAELVDAHWLFANYAATAAPKKEELVCLIPDWDPWMQNMLRPLVEAAGYRVVDDAENEAADLVIACLGEELPEHASHKTIWLRPEPEAASKKDFSIYRYDRAGLLMALKSAGAGRGK